MNKNANEPAYPFVERSGEIESVTPGLSKREIFAKAAMQGILSNSMADPFGGMKQVAEQAVMAADALLLELEKLQP